MKKAIFKFLLIITLIISFIFISSNQVNEKIKIYAPYTPSSIPYIIASKNMKNIELTIFSNHSQANALFLKGDIQILTTGLSVGMTFFKKEIPIKIVNSYVSGLSYLVTYGKKVNSFSELKGQKLYLPFKGSPIEEITSYFISQEGLDLNKDFIPTYSVFPSSVELLKQGKAKAVILPEPFVSILENKKNIFISLSYKKLWEKYTGIKNGYPQVGTFVKSDWLKDHKEFINQLNLELKKAIELIQSNPEKAVEISSSYFTFPENILLKALNRTSFHFEDNNDLKSDIFNYYKILGKPLNDKFESFFYIY